MRFIIIVICIVSDSVLEADCCLYIEYIDVRELNTAKILVIDEQSLLLCIFIRQNWYLYWWIQVP